MKCKRYSCNMEVDERLRWLEARISSSLRPKGGDLRNLLADARNRTALLSFCNNSEARCLYVYLPSDAEGSIQISSHAPETVTDKSIFFLKCYHAAKLNRENISGDVAYSECSKLPLEHLKLVTKEVYLPLLCVHHNVAISADQLLDLMHRLLGAMQVTSGFVQNRVVLPLPSIEVLAEAATSDDRKPAIIRVLESAIIAWMKQVKMVLLMDPHVVITQMHGRYPQPMAELEFWESRLSKLVSLQDQLGTVVVLNILHNLEKSHSTYAHAFIHVHRDVGKAIVDTELCLLYLNSLKPWMKQLADSYSTEALTHIFPPLMHLLFLTWQYSSMYSISDNFHRLLRFLANSVMLKAKETIGKYILNDPEQGQANLKQALRICAAFRGCYLDYKEKADGLLKLRRAENMAERTDCNSLSLSLLSFTAGSSLSTHISSTKPLCPWPARNSPVFTSLNAIMERCNDLMELVQTILHFREVELAVVGTAVGEGTSSCDPIMADIHADFTRCMNQFCHSTKDLLCLDDSGQSFEESFFLFRSTMRSLEKRCSVALKTTFELCPSLMAELRVADMYQELIKRDAIKKNLDAICQGIVAKVMCDVQAAQSCLTHHLSCPPVLKNMPSVASKLLWLHALRERVNQPMGQLRSCAPQLLEGDLGWRLRQAVTDICRDIESHMVQAENVWLQSIPIGLPNKVKDAVLSHTASGLLQVNMDPTLWDVLHEATHLTRPPLCVSLPPYVRLILTHADPRVMRERVTLLQSVVQAYNQLREGLLDVDEQLFQSKLQSVDNLISLGTQHITWNSPEFSEFIVKSRAAILKELATPLQVVHNHTKSIRAIVQAWSQGPNIDIFKGAAECRLEDLNKAHMRTLESLQHSLPLAMESITAHVNQSFLAVDTSHESPAWLMYLNMVDEIVLEGLRALVLTAIGTLVDRAQHYERGTSIPALIQVDLELQGRDVLFSPPLMATMASLSIPEVVQQWLTHYMDLSKLVRRVAHDSESCYAAISIDPEIKSNFSKITAHMETCARQCQSLRKRFSIYEFLWEQDVQKTFCAFLIGQTAPHPRRFTRPETVRSRASARVHSAQSRSSTPPASEPLPLVATSNSTLMGVMGMSDWEFLKPPSLEEKEGQSHPSLDDFDGELAVFQGVLERLCNIDDSTAVGWLLVNQSPAKNALSSLASKWKAMYAGHLEQQISRVLESLEEFFVRTEPEVEGITGEEAGTQAFMKLMAIFNKVNMQQAEMDTKFGALHRAVLMLDKFGYPLSKTTRELFAIAPQRWSNLKKRVALGKQRIGPRIQASGTTITQDLRTFGDTFGALHGDFCSSRCVLADCPVQEARSSIDHFERQLSALKLQARDLIELQELLETNVFNFSRLKEFEEELQTLKQVWSHAESVRRNHSQWKLQKWYTIDTAELQLAAERQLQVINSVSKKWDIQLSVAEDIGALQATLLMIDGLRSTAMRPRHWKQVLRYASSAHTQHLGRGSLDVNELHELTLGQLVDLGLHNHSTDVGQIVDRANKDIAIESLLNNFEEVWLSKQLDLVLHTKPTANVGHHDAFSDLKLDRPSTSVTPKPRAPSAHRRPRSSHPSSRISQSTSDPAGVSVAISLLGHTGGIFEQLEHHQVSLQALMGTAAAAAFADDLSMWHKQFQTIETVLRTWLSVQQLWIQLEQVFASSDIEQFLASYAFIFAGVNKEWRELMVQTAKNPSIMQVCLRSDLLPLLEKMLGGLQKCQKALLQHMDSQRLQCPWFSFLPLEDILELICCGYDVQQLGSSLKKVIPFMSGLLVDPFTHHRDVAKNYKVTGLVSHHGEELEFVQGVVWDGATENLVGGVVGQTSHTLQDQLARLAAQNLQKPGESQVPLSLGLPPTWTSAMATQVVILYTQLLIDHTLASSSTPAHLASIAQELNTCMQTAQQILHGRGKASQTNPPPQTIPTPQSNSTPRSNPTPQSNPPPQTHTPSYSHSDLVDTQSDQQLVPLPSDSNIVDEGEVPQRLHVGPEDMLQPYMVVRLQAIIQTLVHYRSKVQHFLGHLSGAELVQGASPDPSHSFMWQCTPHFEWSPPTPACTLSCLQARVPYAYRYTGTAPRLMLTPSSERCLLFLMHTISQGSSPFLTGPETSDTLNEFALLTGQSLFTLACTAQVTHTTVTEYLRGMVATSSWIHLQGAHTLTPSVLQTLCTQLLQVHQARAAKAASVKLASYVLNLAHSTPSVCLASGDFTLLSRTPLLPSSTFEVFKMFASIPADRKVTMEGLLLAHQFTGAPRLAGMLEKFWLGAEELFTHSTLRPSEARIDLPCSHQLLRRTVALAQRHLMEFEQLQGGGGMGEGSDQCSMPSSLQHSDRMRASLRMSLGDTAHPHDDAASLAPSSRRTMEELSLLMAVKDCLLAAAPPDTLFRTALVMLMADSFPCLDLQALLEHEATLRLELSSQQDKEGVESSRESRAASVMQMVTEDRHSTDDSQTIEETIVQCCHVRQLSPTPEFQAAVIQLLAMVEAHPIVAIAGPSCSGKTQCIQVAADVLRSLGRVLTSYTVTCGALRELELFGYQDTEENVWTDGLLSQLLLRANEVASSELGWFILDGELTSTQLDILTSFLSPDSTIKFSNGRRIPVTQSQRFIIEVPDLSSFTPTIATSIPRVCLATRTVSWDAVVHKWLLAISEDNDQMSTLSSICARYIPNVLCCLVPVLLDGMELRQSSNQGNSSTLEPQDQRYSSVHLTQSCCAILQCMLGDLPNPSSPLQLEACFVYSAVWAFGGVLGVTNKRKFDLWWRKEFTALPLPANGTLWDCYVKEGQLCSWTLQDPPLSLSRDEDQVPYVHTAQSARLGHLVNMLISRGHPVLVEGPTGSGKTSLLREAMSASAKGMVESHMLHIYATRLSNASSLWAQLGGCLQWHWGRRYRPRGGKRLVCFIDDLHNAQASVSSSASICELVRHHIATGGILEPVTSKWYSVSDVSYVCTTSDSVATLSNRFLRHFVVLSWDGYNLNQMINIFSHILSTLAPPTCLNAHFLSQLVHTAVEVHFKIQELFQPMPERVHYLFTMRHLATVFRKLCLQPQLKPQDVLLLWQQESWWVYAGVMSSDQDREQYHDMVYHVLRKFFSEEGMSPLILDKDSIRLPSHVTEQLTAKLANAIQEHNTSNPTLHVSLYQSAVEEIWWLSHVISLPHDIGHVMLIGHAYPDPMVHLCALNCGHTVVQPSHNRVPRPEGAHRQDTLTQVQEFRESLLAIYTTAGLKNENIVLFINAAELVDELYLVCVYEFVKDNGISAFFSDESQSKIISAIRSDLTQAGLQFDKDTAWSFFLRRVRKNVRVVLSVQSIPLALGSECRIWRELLNVMQIYYHQPWDNRQLVGVATHHLRAVCGLSNQDESVACLLGNQAENVAHLLGNQAGNVACLLGNQAENVAHLLGNQTGNVACLLGNQAENVAHLLGSIHSVLRDKLKSSPQRGWDQTSNVMFEYFVERFVHELEKFLAATRTKHARVLSSLECIQTAIAKVATLGERVNREKLVLEEKSTACIKLLSQIGQDTAILKEHTKLLDRQVSRIAHLNEVLPEYEHALELASDEMRQLVGQNKDLVLGMDEGSLAELRALQRPSPELEELLAAVIMIVKSPTADTSWTKGAKRLMANLDRFCELLLQSTESEDNSETILCALDPLMEKLSSNEAQLREKNPEAGLAAAQLCSWVHGMMRLHTGLQTKRRPLEVRVATMKASLNEYTEKLKQQENKVKVLQERLESLGVALATASVDQTKQEEQVQSMVTELEQTLHFIKALTPVSELWKEEEVCLSNCLHDHLGLLILGTALATYLGSVPPHVQMILVNAHLQHLLIERGVALQWKVPHPLTFYDYSAPEEGKDGGCTYSQFSACVLPLLCDELTLVKWVAMGYNLSQLVHATLLLSSWKRWPLAFDTNQIVVSMLGEHIGDRLVVLDWSSKAPTLLPRLEHAMTAGEPVLIKNIGPMLDPALQSVMELGRTRDTRGGLQVIKFGGRRLHVHPSFRLFLCTTLPPSLLHSSLTNATLMVDFSICEPMACELLLRTAFDASHKGEDYREVSQQASLERQRLVQLEEELFALLESRNKNNTYWSSAGEFVEHVQTRTEAQRRLDGLEVRLSGYQKTLCCLRPLCSHCARLYQLVTQASKGNLSVSWQSFLSWFTTWFALQTAGLKDTPELRDGVIRSFHETVVQSTISSLEHDSWLTLLVQLAVLSHVIQIPDPTLQRDQLSYLASPEDQPFDDRERHCTLVQPQCITDELWSRLLSAPLRTDYLRRATAFPSFWEGLKTVTVSMETSFPWRDPNTPMVLDDLVMLSLLNHKAFLALLGEEAGSLVSCIRPESLNVTNLFSGLGTHKPPILFLFDQTSIASQTCLWYLETELRQYLKTSGRTLQVFFLGAGFEDIPDSLSTSNTDSTCALIGDVQFASKQCLTWLPQWLRQGGQTVVLTNPSHCPLPFDVVHSSHPHDLTRLILQPLGHAHPLTPWLNAKVSFHDALLILLSNMPESLVTRCDTFENSTKPLVFNLAVFHAAVCVLVGGPVQPHLADFMSALSLAMVLCSGDPRATPMAHIVGVVRAYLQGVYGKCCPPDSLQCLLESCFSATSVCSEARVVVGADVTVVVPSSDVPVRCYAEYAVGLRSHSQDRVLLPDAAQMANIVQVLADMGVLSEGTDVSANASRVVHDLLSGLRELLPLHPAELVEPCQRVEGLGTLQTCDKLASAQLYHSYVHAKAVEELNTILEVVMGDLRLLSQSPALNLPHPLLPVLQAILSGRMPSRWWSGPSISLDEGLNMLHKWHSILSQNRK